MSDREEIEKLYEDMYRAMINKDRAELERVHDAGFVLVHMSGMQQDKKVYIESIMNGTLNYYSARTQNIDIQIDGETATMTGQSLVNAAVFGGGRHTWRLQLTFELVKRDGEWRLVKAQAATY